MIEGAIIFIEENLNAYLQNKMNYKEERVISSNLVGQDGSVAIRDDNRVVISLIDLEQESTLINANRIDTNNNGESKTTLPPVNLNLFVMFSCFFTSTNYKESLKYLSNIILFFQGRPLFTHTMYPQLNKYGIKKLTFEMYHPDYQSLNNLWTILGIKYLPSVIYKVKMLSMSEELLTDELPAISSLDQNQSDHD